MKKFAAMLMLFAAFTLSACGGGDEAATVTPAVEGGAAPVVPELTVEPEVTAEVTAEVGAGS